MDSSHYIKIGNLEIMKKDLGKMTWVDAQEACAKLGDGWRLPTSEELNVLYENKKKIGGFASKYYWSSIEIRYNGACINHMGNGGFAANNKNSIYSVRAVRSN